MTRAEAVAFLAEEWPGLASALGVTATDDSAGWKQSIDGALRAMGVPFASLSTATVAVADETDFMALLDYYGARRLYAEAAVKVDVSVSGGVGVSKQYSQMRDGLKELIAQYEDTVPDAYRVGGMVVYAQQATRDPDPYAVEEVTA